MKRFILFEHASGYAIFKIIAHQEIGTLLQEVQESIDELDRFGKVTKLYAYAPFGSAQVALDNAISVCEGLLSPELEEFLSANVRVSSKVTLGIADTRLATLVQEKLGIKCTSGDYCAEIIRGIRIHFPKMIEGTNAKSLLNAQLGLAHSLSRTRVKFNANKDDNMIMQSISLVDQLDKDINTFSMRIREWYSYHFPELFPIVKDSYLFAKVANFIGDRRKLKTISLSELAEVVGDEGMAKKIIEASKTSIGMAICEIDLVNIMSFSLRVIQLSNYRKELFDYLIRKMNLIAPNLSRVVGELVGAKLILQAGSLINLAKCPASTVQILGAEKALFRALKTRGKTPKYGIIYHSSFIGRAPLGCKGRISRLLAHKCSIASRLDCFSDNPCDIIGKKLQEQIEERVQYYHHGDFENSELPKRNAEVMQEALQELDTHLSQVLGSDAQQKKAGKKKKVGKARPDCVAVEQ